jgi:hypothetical protein
MSYTAIMAHTYSGDPYSIVGWCSSRKLNGNRAIWNGKTLQTLGRYSGAKIIYPPAWWSQSALPIGIPCDGELWHVSDDKDLVRSIVGQGIGKSTIDPRWADIRYMVFDYKPYSLYESMKSTIDLPPWVCHDYYLNYKWSQRQEILHNSIIKHIDYCVKNNMITQCVQCEQTQILSADHAKELIDKSKNSSWEGLIFANPEGLYTCTRSHNLLKSKPMYDYECYVNGIEMGDPLKKYAGVVGSLKCFLVWNEQVLTFKGGRDDMIGQRVSFDVSGMSDDLRESWMDPSKRPSIIRFSFLEVSKYGIPQSPNYIESEK